MAPLQQSRSPDGLGQHPLPGDGFPLATHFAVLRRFMSVSRNGVDPVDPQSVEGGEIPPGAAQSNASFLAELGLLVEEAPGKFKPTGAAMQYVNTVALDESRGRRLLRSYVGKMWYARAATAVLQSRGTVPVTDLTSLLAAEAQVPTRPGERAAAVLLEYLAYTGIVVVSGEAVSLAGASPRPGAPYPPPPRSPPIQAPAGPTPVTSPSAEAPPPVARRGKPARAGPKGKATGWKKIETDDFELKIRPDPAAIGRLRKQLELLEEEVRDRGD